MNIEQLVAEAIALKDNKKTIPCKKGFEIAETLQISPAEVGRYCNEHGVKISRCQLGCF